MRMSHILAVSNLKKISHSDLSFCFDKTQYPVIPFSNMFELKPFQSYFMAIYGLGLGPFVSFSKPSSKSLKIIHQLPRTLNICVHLVMIYIFIITDFAILPYFMGIYLVIALSLVNFIGIIENVYNSNLIFEILKIVCYIVKDLKTGLQTEYLFNALKANLKRKYLTLFIIFMFGLIIKNSLYSNIGSSRTITFFTVMIYSLKYIYLFHITFYIDFVKTSLISLNARIATLRKDWPLNDTKNAFYLMRRMKLIHFKLWHVSQRVTLIFGWFLVAYMIDVFAAMVFGMYWMFIYAIRIDVDHINILRK